MVEHIDSAKVNQVVQNVLSGEADGIAAMKSLEAVFQPYQELRKLVDSLLETKTHNLIDCHLLKYTFNEYRLLNRAAGQMIIQVNVPSASMSQKRVQNLDLTGMAVRLVPAGLDTLGRCTLRMAAFEKNPIKKQVIQDGIDGVNRDKLIDLSISVTTFSSTKIDPHTVIKG